MGCDIRPSTVASVLAERVHPRVTHVELVLTRECNLACEHCYVRDKMPGAMDLAVARKAVDFVLSRSGDRPNIGVAFFGGEPLLRLPLLCAIAEYARQAARGADKIISFALTTNGTLLSGDALKRLLRLRIRPLVSIDGLDRDHDVHRSFADGRGSFHLIREALPVLKKRLGWVGVRVTVFPSSASRLRKNCDGLFALGINQLIVAPGHDVRWERHDVRTFERALKELAELYLELLHAGKPVKISLFTPGPMGSSESPSDDCDLGTCNAGGSRICVTPDGRIYGCSKLALMDGGILPLGHVDTGFDNPAARARLQSRHEPSPCQRCDLRGSCSGGCPAVNMATTGTLRTPDPSWCLLAAAMHRAVRYARRRAAALGIALP